MTRTFPRRVRPSGGGRTGAPIRAGEVLVRVARGICGTDLHEYVAGPIVTRPSRTR